MTEQEIINKIKEIFKEEINNNVTLIYNKALLKLKHNSIECYNYINSKFLEDPTLWNNSLFKYLLHILYNIQLNKCKMCNKIINFDKTRKGQIYCSYKCTNTDKDLQLQKTEHSKITCLKKYGVTHPLKLQSIKEKREQTNLKKYGVKCVLSNKEIQQKKENTCLKKYGTKCVLSLDTTKEKTKKYFLEKYGVEYPTQANEIKEKQKQGLLKSIGYDNPFKSPIVREKAKQSLLKHFGTDCSLKAAEIKEKSKETIRKKYNVDNICQSKFIRDKLRNASFDRFWNNTLNSWSNYIIPLFTREQFYGIKNNIYKWQCAKCGHIFEDHIHTTRHLEKTGKLANCPRCLKCYPFIENSTISKSEIELCNFCKEFFPNLQSNIKTVISPYELDIYIPEIKLALEFNGDFFHSIESGTPHGYHLMKTKMCEKLGIRLIHIWEYEWTNNKDQIKQKLFNVFLNNENINYSSILDRSWYSILNINNNYKIIELMPTIIELDNKRLHIENCGYLKCIKIN